MTVLNYNTAHARAPQRPVRIASTCHSGPSWICAVRCLRSALHNAREHAAPRRSATTESVGDLIIDHIAGLDAPSLHVLQVTFGILVRASQRNQP